MRYWYARTVMRWYKTETFIFFHFTTSILINSSEPYVYIPTHFETSSVPSCKISLQTRCAIMAKSGFGGLEVACWPLVPQGRGIVPGQSRRIFRAKKILSTPSFGGKVKPSVSCRSFTACKRSLNVTWISAFRQHFSPTVPPSAAGCSRMVTRVETPGDESWNV